MAVDLSKLALKRRLEFEELKDKVIAIDAYNVIYQFLSIIRQADGAPLMDSHGNVTSHLSGLFYRTIDMLDYGIKPIYVFDGLPSPLKERTNMARAKRREKAQNAYEEAKESGDVELMRMHAMASTRINKVIVASSKELLDCMGIGHINAPSEGEAQASYMSKKGIAYAAASQDYDTLLFGSNNVVRNLTFSGKRKLPRKNVYINVEPEIINLQEMLKSLGINQKQLIWIGMMLGTDFNKGIKGIGPKTAMRIASAAKSLDEVNAAIKEKFDDEFEFDVREVEDLFLKPEVKDISDKELDSLLTREYNKERLIEFMCNAHGFSEERISKTAARLEESKRESKQKGIGGWLK